MKFARGLGWVSQQAGVVQHQNAHGKRDERGSSMLRERGERRIEGAGDRERERERVSVNERVNGGWGAERMRERERGRERGVRRKSALVARLTVQEVAPI